MSSEELLKGAGYVEQERRDYSLYVLQQRAIPHAADGLKAAARRVLWTAKDGKKYKSATLAGATMPIHPHQTPEGAVNTLAAPYGNNIPLLDGDGAFGTLLNPTAYGAARYTSVKVSQFCKDVIFRDIEIVPLQDNYDGTLQEPKHFLPLVPTVLLNPQEGIAVGFASNILPRTIQQIIKSQIAYLKNEAFYEELPTFKPTNQKTIEWEENDNGAIVKFWFAGEFEKVSATVIRITNLPYGITHEKYIAKLDKLEESGIVVNYEDKSRDKYNIIVTVKRGTLSKLDDNGILRTLQLFSASTENMNMIDFGGKRVWNTTYGELIQQFCDWRLEWYVTRYKRLADNLAIDIQRFKDVLRAINRNVGGVAKKIGSRTELKEFLEEIGIIHVNYIADLPVYRFTEEEKQKTEAKLEEANNIMKQYMELLRNPQKRRDVYISELEEILENTKRQKYS